MSKTDCTRPYWVIDFFEGVVDHDHRGGVCRVETLDEAAHGARFANRHPRSACGHYEFVVVPCPGATRCWAARTRAEVLAEVARERHDVDAPQIPLSTLYLRNSKCLDEHFTAVYHADWDCSRCAEPEDSITCTRRVPQSYVTRARMFGQGVPASYRRELEHASRHRVNLVLRDACRDHNANGDTDIEPEPTRHRHNAQWSWF